MRQLHTAFFISLLFFCLFDTEPLFAQELTNPEDILFQEIPMVTSAIGREQKITEVASAMTVISKEEIQRSGARNIPDLFYRVPGMQVRKVSGSEYFVAIRSAATSTTSNLLVMVDGVVVFNPIFSATFWDTIPVPLNEIERIEIIRGPGGVLYSSNAVNGVINIITKKANEKDNYVAVRGGTMDFVQAQLGAGQKINDKLSVRAFTQYGKTTGFDKQVLGARPSNESANDIVGLKTQYNWSQDTSLVVDAKSNNETATDTLGGANKREAYDQMVLTEFQQKVNDVYDYSVHIDDNSSRVGVDAKINTISGATQHNLKYAFLGAHVTSFGTELRYSRLNAAATFDPTIRDSKNSQRIVSFFIQDEYRPTDKWILTAGTRATKNTLVQPEKGELFEPRGTAVYLLTDKQNLRAVVSRTYRTPSFFEKEAAYQSAILGTQTEDPERSMNYEVGWQGLFLQDKLNMNTSVFYSTLKDPILGSGFFPVVYNNDGSLRTIGVEWDGSYKLTDDLALKSDYTYANADPKAVQNPISVSAQNLLLSKHQVGLGLDYIKDRWTIDFYAKWISKYINPTTSAFQNYRKFPSYYKTTVRVAYAFKIPGMRMKENDAEFEVIGNDFIGGNTIEGAGINRTLFREPDVYAGLKVKF